MFFVFDLLRNRIDATGLSAIVKIIHTVPSLRTGDYIQIEFYMTEKH